MARVLVVNTGSSSIKYQLFDMEGEPKALASGVVERIGEAGGKLTHRAGDAEPLVVEDRMADHSEGFDRVFRAFGTVGEPIGELAGIGHRVVHGGDRLTAPTLIDDEAVKAIAELAYSSTVFRFDGSDQMPGAVGAGTFWKGMTAWISGQQDLDEALNSIEESWPS